MVGLILDKPSLWSASKKFLNATLSCLAPMLYGGVEKLDLSRDQVCRLRTITLSKSKRSAGIFDSEPLQ
jgi:hypothetical protein